MVLTPTAKTPTLPTVRILFLHPYRSCQLTLPIEEYFGDLITAYRAELTDLYAAGCRNIQFDDPQLIEFASEESLEGMREYGMDPDKLLQMYVDVYNRILEGRPGDLRVGIHICRGNFAVSAWGF